MINTPGLGWQFRDLTGANKLNPMGWDKTLLHVDVLEH